MKPWSTRRGIFGEEKELCGSCSATVNGMTKDELEFSTISGNRKLNVSSFCFFRIFTYMLFVISTLLGKENKGRSILRLSHRNYRKQGSVGEYK